ncbi:hypothetical protein HG530_011166 [Fusarium avenaceum]|nr:hypothetical protein HG530_011166 [Fusarium avenaceum]
MPCAQPSINSPCLSVDIATLIASQEQRNTGDLISRAASLGGIQLADLLLTSPGSRSFVDRCCHACLNQAGADGVDANTSSGQLVRYRLGERDDGGFGGRYRHKLIFAEVGEQGGSPNDTSIGKEDIQATVALDGIVYDFLDLGLIRSIEASRVDFHLWKRSVDLLLVSFQVGIVKVTEIQCSRAAFSVLMRCRTADSQR